MIFIAGHEVGLEGDEAKAFDEIRKHIQDIGTSFAKEERPVLWIDCLLAALIKSGYISTHKP